VLAGASHGPRLHHLSTTAATAPSSPPAGQRHHRLHHRHAHLHPYYQWRWEHSLHHATTGDLDRRGIGDVWTMTVQEYLESSRWKRFAYKLARNPIVLFAIAPFVSSSSSAHPQQPADARERRSVWYMNLALLGMGAALSSVFGLGTYLIIQTIITVRRRRLRRVALLHPASV
jgi:hypothetical protein